jgi:hypothetical protein
MNIDEIVMNMLYDKMTPLNKKGEGENMIIRSIKILNAPNFPKNDTKIKNMRLHTYKR